MYGHKKQAPGKLMREAPEETNLVAMLALHVQLPD